MVSYRYHDIGVKQRETFNCALITENVYLVLNVIQFNIMLRFNFFLWCKLWFPVWWSMVMHIVMQFGIKENRN